MDSYSPTNHFTEGLMLRLANIKNGLSLRKLKEFLSLGPRDHLCTCRMGEMCLNMGVVRRQ